MSIRSSSSKHHRTQSNFTDYEPNRRRGSSDSNHRSDRHSSSDRSSSSKRRREDDRSHGHSKRRRHTKDRDSRSKSRSERHRSKSPSEQEPVEQDEEYRKRVEQQLKMADDETEEEKRIRKRRERMAAIMAKHANKKKEEEDALTTNTEDKKEDKKTAEPVEKAITEQQPTPMETEPSEKPETKPPSEKKAATPQKPAFDLFSDEPVVNLFESQPADVEKAKKKGPDPAADHEGYFKARIGDVIGDKYKVIGFHGKGQFGNVLKATNIETGQNVAIKFLRANDVMKRSGVSEIKFLEEIRAKDPHNARNCVLLLEKFQERGHLCLVFEDLAQDLRQFRKSWKGGLPISYVRAYAFRLLNSLALLEKLGIIHADLKPDNILVTKDGKNIKLADFGSAMNESQVQVTPLLVSRYYRAPEIILGMKYDMSIDMFALGATVYELAVGRPMLQSRDNNHHLSLILEYKGAPPKKFLAKGCFSRDHFDTQGRFLEHDSDPADPTRAIVRKVTINRKRSISADLNRVYSGLSKDQKEFVGYLADFIEKCCEIIPEKRLTPLEGRRHHFFTKALATPEEKTEKKK